MYKTVGMVMIITIFLAGCINNDTDSVEGEIFEVNQEEETFVVFVENELNGQEINQSEQQKSMEAFLVEPHEDVEIKGEVKSFNDLKQGQKVVVEIGNYEEKLVTKNALFKKQSKLPSYESKSVTVTPYSKEDIVQEIRVEEGYGLISITPNQTKKEGTTPILVL